MLEASAALSMEDRRVLAIQTDNQDAGRVDRWDSLLSGYPLPSGAYAWSMTWAATELPRPGCVWTHSLLLSDEALSVRWSPIVLSTLFERPSSSVDFTPYGRPLAVSDDAANRSAGAAELDRHFVSALLWGLFEAPTRPLRVPGLTLSDDERHVLLLSIWSQQWTGARVRLKLADAPISARSLGPERFDLQLHAATRMQDPAEDERILTQLPESAPPPWARRLANDVIKPGPLRIFFHTYGEAQDSRRELSSTLASIWLALDDYKSPESAHVVLSRIAEAFPERGDWAALKSGILDTSSPPAGCRAAISDPDLLVSLCSFESKSVFDESELAVSERVDRLLQLDAEDVNHVLSAALASRSPYGAEILDEIANPPRAVLRRGWASLTPAVVAGFVVARPEVATRKELWLNGAHEAIWSALDNAAEIDWGAVLKAAIEAEAEPPPRTESVALAQVKDHLLDVLSSTIKGDSSAWVGLMRPTDRVKWLNRGTTSRSPDLVLDTLGALPAQTARKVAPHVYLEVLREADPEGAALAFVAAISHSDQPGWEPVAMLALEELLATPEIHREAPEVLKAVIPGPEVPRADQLARAANQAFQRDVWDPAVLLTSQTPLSFSAVLRADKKAGLAKRVFRSAQNRSIELDPEQENTLVTNIRERAEKPKGFLEDVVSFLRRPFS